MLKRVSYHISGVALLMAVLFSACENDMKKLQRISSQEGRKSYNRHIGVDVIFSDSTHVKMHLTTPLMLDYTAVKSPYRVMPKGVKGVFYDDNLKPSSTIVADSAINREKEQRIELYKHVVATNTNGDVFKSEELIYNQQTHRVYSGKPVVITTAGGNVIHGDGLETNEKFSPWTVTNTKAKILVDQNLSQQ
jgi:LPS export ABC transporter protein LptC